MDCYRQFCPMKTSPWYNSRLALVFFHGTAWLFTLFLPLLLRHFSDDGQRLIRTVRRTMLETRRMPPINFAAFEISINILWILLFYINVFFLLPAWFKKKKYGRYVLFQVAVFLVTFISLVYYFNSIRSFRGLHFPLPALTMSLFPFLFVQAAGITYTTIREKIKLEQLQQEKENEQLKSELSFLRSQISPHFIFNVLNNMVSLARKKSDRLEPALIELSGLMRYMLYESDESKVPLAKEINYLKNYIELQLMRFGNEVEIRSSFPEYPPLAFIEPMMLIPFVENAFKHVAQPYGKSFIDIRIQYENGELKMLVKNSYTPKDTGTKDAHSGIGLQNVKRRLNLLYKDQHYLTISEEDRTYIVELHIKIT